MEVFPDYSHHSLSELRDALQRTDPKNSDGLHEELLAEIHRRQAPQKQQFKPWSITHGLLGLNIGLVVYGFYAYIVAINTPNYRVAGKSFLWDIAGLLIPFLFLIFGARYSKLPRLEAQGNFTVVNSLGFVVLILLAVDFTIVYLTQVAGSC